MLNGQALQEYIEARLYQWAEWHSRGNFSGLGFPQCSLEYRMMTEGVFPRSRGRKPLPSNDAAEEIEKLVSELYQHNKKIAQVLICHYFNQGSFRTKGKIVGVSYTAFSYYLNMGHQWIAGRLSGKPLLSVYF